MAETITWTHVVQVGAGVQVSTSQAVSIDAYDVVEVEVGSQGREVQVQPGPPGLLKFLCITSSAYGADLKYAVNDAAATQRVLDAPQVFAGAGAIALLDADPPQTLFFSNAIGADVVVRILAGRDVTPP